jgi:hypothetical protein
MIVVVGFFSLVIGCLIFIAMTLHIMYMFVNTLTEFNFKKELDRLNSIAICFVYFVGFYEMGRFMLQNYISVCSLSSYIH